MFLIFILLFILLFKYKDCTPIRYIFFVLTIIFFVYNLFNYGFNETTILFLLLSFIDIIFILTANRLLSVLSIFISLIFVLLIAYALNGMNVKEYENESAEVSYLYRYNPLNNNYIPVDWTINRFKK